MGLLDDHNPYPGRGTLRTVPPSRTSANVWAVVALVSAVLWIGGLASILAVAAGFWARTELAEAGGTRTMRAVANGAILLGVAGLGIALVAAIALVS